MADNDVGTVVVVGEGNKPVGMVTDRDIVLRCVATGVDPETAQVESIMSKPVQIIEEHQSVEGAIARMGRFGGRRLVVTSETGQLAGVFSLDDFLYQRCEEAEAIGRLLARQQPVLAATPTCADEIC
jgi:CBS domain-containing protein